MRSIKMWSMAVGLLLASLWATAASLPEFTELIEKQSPAVVNISTTQTVKGQGPSPFEGDPFYEFFRRFAPPVPREYQASSLGSGFIISGDGYILTNAHVVDAADEVVVKLTDKREFKAKVIGADKRTDVALLKIEAGNLPRVTIGDPEKLKVGEWVLAIGQPFGLENTVTAGIVSAKGRSLPDDTYVPFIQTDAAVNPGNSGGPLFNMRGEVVGINSQIYSRSGGYMGLSFAIPIDVAMDVVNQLKAGGKVSRGKLGVGIQEVTRDIADSMGLDKAQGALVSQVEKGSAADRAGLKAGDVILRFDGKPVAAASDLPRMVGATKPGARVPVQVWRNKAAKDLTVVLGELTDEKPQAERKPAPSSRPDQLSRLGVSVQELNERQRKQLDVPFGLLVTAVQSPAQRYGVQEGDVILGVGSEPIRSLAQLQQALDKAAKGSSVALQIRRDDSNLFIPVKLADK